MARIEFKYAILDKDDTCGLLEDYSTTVAESPVASLEERIRLAIVNMAGIRLKYMETGRCLGVYKIDLEKILKGYVAVRDEYFDSVSTIGIARDMQTPVNNMVGSYGVLSHTIFSINLNGKDMPFMMAIE